MSAGSAFLYCEECGAVRSRFSEADPWHTCAVCRLVPCGQAPPRRAPVVARRPVSVHQSWCMRCVLAWHPTMVTGYGLTACRCDRCGHVSDLALVQVDFPTTREAARAVLRALAEEDTP